MRTVIGRDRELAAVDRALERGRKGFFALLLVGEAGIGKTTIWREGVARAHARGFRVLIARPGEAETGFALSAVADLLSEVPKEVLDALPAVQRHALEVTLVRAEPGSTPLQARTLATGLRSILSMLADEAPVVVAIDDVQWLDAGSATAFGFALRRGTGASVGWLLTRRSDHPGRSAIERALSDDELTRVDVGPLSLGVLHHLLAARTGASLPRPLLRRVHRAAGGNPLFALEIARLLDEVGLPATGEPLPVPADVEALVRRRVRKLPAHTRDVLLTAAALPRPREDPVRAAFGGSVAEALAPAESAGIAALVGDEVVFAHPLYSAAVYRSASSAERRAAHRRLADVADDAEERARHLALALEGCDDAVAAAAHDAAHKAFLRGAPAAAVELVELALKATGSRDERNAELAFDLAYFTYYAGDPIRARQALGTIDDWTICSAALEARARGLEIELALVTDGAHAAVELGERLLQEPLRDEARVRVLAHLSNAYEFDVEQARAHGEAALSLLESLGEDVDPATFARVLCWRVRNRLGLGLGLERGDVERTLALEARLGRERWLGERVSYRFGIWFRHVDELEESRVRLARDLAEADDLGDELLQLLLLVHLGLTECLAGNLLVSRGHLEAAARVAAQLETRPLGLLAARAVLEAHRGDEAAVRELAAEIAAGLDEQAQGDPAAIQAHGALGLLELSLSREAAADEHLRAAVLGVELAGVREPGVFRVHANAAEAAIAVGDLARATRIAGDLERHGRRTNHRSSLATGARVRALLAAAAGDLDAALRASGEALALHAELAMPFEHARTMLVHGQILRRRGRRRDAAESLERARASFDELGSPLWAGKARAELARVPSRRGSGDELTATEARVAELVAQGKTNEEVAQELFVTKKTVEANLTRIYRKLGVRSRFELATRLGEQDGGTKRQ